jgi:hypothetical protein
MKRKALGVVLAIAATAPAIVAPKLVAQAQAQAAATAPAEYPDVPRGHWAYDAIDALSRAGIIEGRPGGVYEGNRPMTRYEFAVAIARLLQKIPGQPTTVAAYSDQELRDRITRLEARPTPDITRAEVQDLITALRTEFADELSRLGQRMDAFDTRLGVLENRVVKPPRLTLTPSILHRTGSANYIDNGPGGAGRVVANPASGLPGATNAFAPFPATPLGGTVPGRRASVFRNYKEGQYGYTDFELRLTDRVTDRLSVNAAIRSLGSTQEDPWAGDILNGLGGGGFYLREANAVADLGDRSFLRGLNLILGRQRTKIGQGLLYDNDLAPTDQIQAQFNLGPLQINGIYGGINNQNITGIAAPNNPYIGSGAAFNIGLNGGGSVFGPGNRAASSGAACWLPRTRRHHRLSGRQRAVAACWFQPVPHRGQPGADRCNPPV